MPALETPNFSFISNSDWYLGMEDKETFVKRALLIQQKDKKVMLLSFLQPSENFKSLALRSADVSIYKR